MIVEASLCQNKRLTIICNFVKSKCKNFNGDNIKYHTLNIKKIKAHCTVKAGLKVPKS
jgi:hypothetical protein